MMSVQSIKRAGLALAFLAMPFTTSAQATAAKATVSVTGGHAAFLDDSVIHHAVLGGGAEWVVHSRIAVGPELIYMVGPESDRDLFVLGVARVGIVPLNRRVVPVVMVRGGFMTHSDRFGGTTFRSSEGAFVFGGGVRVCVTSRVYVAPEVSLGWEPQLRTSVTVGIKVP